MASTNNPKNNRTRDLVVGVLAVLALVGVGAAALNSLNARQDPAPPDPAAAAARFADAWLARDADTMETLLVRRVGDQLTKSMAAFDTLEPTAFTIKIGEVLPGSEEGFSSVIIHPTMEVPEVGTWTWASEVPMERGRGAWRIRWDHTAFHPSLADGLHFEIRFGPATRAPILGNDGTPLTSNGEVVTIGIEPSRVPSAQRLGDSLASLVPEAVEPLAKVFARNDLVSTWFYPLITVPSERLAGIRERVETLPGVILRGSEGRVGQSAGFGRHLLGRVVDATEADALERGVEPGTPIGVGGLEEDFDAQLRGSEVAEIIAVEADGDVRASVASFSDDVAESVRTTIDPLVQEAIENALVGQPDRIAVVAVGRHGGVLGSASRPLTGYNRAFAGNYAPGAAVWGLTVLAALENGVDAETLLGCPASATVGGVAFNNLAGFDLGEVTLQEAVANGCRSSIARLAGDLPRQTMHELAGHVGFNTGLDGLPTAAWPRARDIAEEAAGGVGQGQLVAPVALLASIASSFADGTWHAPYVLLEEERTGLDGADLPISPAALTEARAIFERSGAQAGLGAGVGLVAGEGSSAEGNLGWSSMFNDELGLVVLVEGGTRADAIGITDRFLDELAALRERG